MKEATLPKRYRRIIVSTIAILTLFTLSFLLTQYRTRLSKLKYYYKARASRLGEIRKAKAGERALEWTQSREQVSRSVWIQDAEGERRQLFLTAQEAHIETKLMKKKLVIKEIFHSTKGALQEELFWKLASTKERVIRRGKLWVKASHPHPILSEEEQHEITPWQRVRFFTAKTAEWHPDEQKLTGHTTQFCIVLLEGHTLPKEPSKNHIIAQGTARTITFSLDKKGKQHVICHGMNLNNHENLT